MPKMTHMLIQVRVVMSSIQAFIPSKCKEVLPRRYRFRGPTGLRGAWTSAMIDRKILSSVPNERISLGISQMGSLTADHAMDPPQDLYLPCMPCAVNFSMTRSPVPPLEN